MGSTGVPACIRKDIQLDHMQGRLCYPILNRFFVIESDHLAFRPSIDYRAE